MTANIHLLASYPLLLAPFFSQYITSLSARRLLLCYGVVVTQYAIPQTTTFAGEKKDCVLSCSPCCKTLLGDTPFFEMDTVLTCMVIQFPCAGESTFINDTHRGSTVTHSGGKHELFSQ
jgi:hypothetical protein